MAETSVSQTAPVVQNIHGRPATTSRDVASYFGKRHVDVIDSIRKLQLNCPEEFTERNFSLSEYTDATGRSLPMFTLYRDDFMLLVMGYTGKRALAVKLAYIEAFNRMEAALAAAPAPGPARRNIADDIIPTPPYAPALGWAGESVICAADGRPMRILQPLPASALQGPLREARAELGNLRQSLLRYVRGEANCAPGILLPMLDAVLDNVDELLLGLQRSPELR